jgi:drug/metabolite transporter (DMT)-like permease
MSLSLAPILTRQAAPVNRIDVGLRYAVVLVCAASAGAHAALTPDHLREGGVGLGGAFLGAAVAPALLALALRRPRPRRWVPPAAVLVLLGTAIAYVLSRTTGLPLLISHPEEVDLVGSVTSATEVAGAIASTFLMIRRDSE